MVLERATPYRNLALEERHWAAAAKVFAWWQGKVPQKIWPKETTEKDTPDEKEEEKETTEKDTPNEKEEKEQEKETSRRRRKLMPARLTGKEH